MNSASQYSLPVDPLSESPCTTHASHLDLLVLRDQGLGLLQGESVRLFVARARGCDDPRAKHLGPFDDHAAMLADPSEICDPHHRLVWNHAAAVTEPQTPHTVIITQHVTAAHLFEMWTHLPMTMFVSDGDERSDPDAGGITSSYRG